MLASIIIRTLNEEKHLDELLRQIKQQVTDNLQYEIILVDSGSDDGTLAIAESHDCKIINIKRKDISFGRSLNLGCAASVGDYLVMISGHCVPTSSEWLQALCNPLIQGKSAYSYGRQIGGELSWYSELRIFERYYPKQSTIPQEGFYCNTANSALRRTAWENSKFDEELTGLEDMELAKRLVERGEKIAYVSESCVFHYHEENWSQVKRRFEREAIALQRIMPQVHIHVDALIRYIFSSINLDMRVADREKVLLKSTLEIIQYRLAQYWGSYVGNHDHRKLSFKQKEEYFYPLPIKEKSWKKK